MSAMILACDSGHHRHAWNRYALVVFFIRVLHTYRRINDLHRGLPGNNNALSHHWAWAANPGTSEPHERIQRMDSHLQQSRAVARIPSIHRKEHFEYVLNQSPVSASNHGMFAIEQKSSLRKEFRVIEEPLRRFPRRYP